MKKTTRLVLSILVAFVAIIVISLYKYARDSPLRISAKDAKERLAKKDVDVVLDVRTDWERKNLGLYPNSLHIPSGDLEVRAAKELPNKGAKILAYCNTGQRARAAAEKLEAMGYRHVTYIAEGHGALL